MSFPRAKTLMILTLAGGIAAAAWAQDGGKRPERKAVNLQVLPKDMSHDSLIAVMHDWEASLGVGCNFCHAKSKTTEGRLDFASDDHRHKQIARYMVKMTDSINRQFFARWDAAKEGHMAVTCYTCHKGHGEPASVAPKEEEEKK
jgi:hypothetical protein